MTSSITVSIRSVKLLRIMVSSIFLLAGFNHLVEVEKTVNRIEMAQFKGFAMFFGNLEILVILSGIVMLIAGISFMIVYKTRWAAIVLMAILIPISITIQVGQITTLGPLFKNVAIAGGLLFFILNDIKPLKNKNNENNENNSFDPYSIPRIYERKCTEILVKTNNEGR